MSQAIINIISNSIKYSKHNEDIFIKSFKTKDNIIISIKDTGIGIDEEHIPFIFERFYRVDDSRTRSTGGTGLGLALSVKITQALGGTLSFDHSPLGGLRCQLTFPKSLEQ